MANRITTLFDFKERGQGLKKIKADVAEVDGSINKAKTGVKGLWAEFKNNRIAQAAVAGMVAKMGTDAVQAASNLEESVNAVNTTFGESSDEIAKLTEASADNYGMSERAFNNMSVALSGFATQIAGDGGNIGGVIDDMATRIADFASVHNLTTEDAMVKFQSALAGETEAMRRYGIDVSAATTKLHAYETGIADVGSELTEAEKVQARYSLLMQETEQWAGDFADTSESLANQQRRLAAEVENAQAKIGAALVPVVEAATGAMIDLAEGVGDVDNAIKNMSGGSENIGSVLGKVFSAGSAPLRGLMAYNEGFLNLVGLTGEAEESLDGATTAAWRNRYANIQAGIEAENAAKAAEEHAEGLRESAEEATYNADVNDEMGRIQEQVTRTVDKAREAQERFMRSIKFTRDEVGALKREIDDEQAWLNLQNTMDDTIAKLNDGEVSARDQRIAILDLKEEVLEYAESINLPDRVVTQLIADIDDGKVAEVEALLARWGNGITLPIRPRVISTGGGSSVRIDEHGSVTPRASGGPVHSGQTYLVGEEGPELLHMGSGQSGSIIPNDKIGGGGGVTVNIMGGYVDDRTIAELERRLDQWRKGVR